MQTDDRLRGGQRQPDKHDLFALQVGVSYVEMRQGRVPRYHRCYFNREFEGRRLQVVVTEIEVADANVSVESINKVTCTLEADSTVSHIKVQ